jgi:hypothetical protein
MHKILFAILMLFASVCQAQDFSSAKQTVDIFLHDLLVKKDMQSVQNSFASNLFTNKLLFSESCSDIKEKDRRNPKKLKQKTIEFFQDITKHAQGNTLKDILVLDSVEHNLEEVKLLSLPIEDKFILAEAEEDEEDKEDDSSDFKMLKAKFPSDSYVALNVLIKYKFTDGELVNFPLYIIWAKENSSWKIIQFGMMCQ